jgi:ribosomal protein S18 acetylase RimI-like enzyme
MNVRSAKREDLDRVLEIDKLSFPKAWDREFLENISKDIFLVFSGPEVYGFLIAGCRHRNVTANILKIAVHPQHRRKGVATHLISKLVEMLRDRQIAEVDVIVLKRCNQAISFYQNVGFKLVSTIPQASNNDDLWVMKLELT